MNTSVDQVYSDLYPVVYDLVEYIPSINALREHYARRILQFDTGGKILEIGSGTGSIIRRLVEKGVDVHRIIGIDNSEEMMRIANRHLPNLKTLKVNLLDRESPLSSINELKEVDLVYTSNFLYQKGICEELPRIFSEASSILQSGGRFLIMEPSEDYSVVKDTMVQSLLSLGSYRYGIGGLIKLLGNISALQEIVKIQPLIIPDKLPNLTDYISAADQAGFEYFWSEKAPDGSFVALFQKN